MGRMCPEGRRKQQPRHNSPHSIHQPDPGCPVSHYCHGINQEPCEWEQQHKLPKTCLTQEGSLPSCPATPQDTWRARELG